MPIRDVQTASDRLADAQWWFKGFAAARPASIDEGSGEHTFLERQIAEVRAFLHRISTGKIRRMGDDTAIVLTYAEFERLVDAVKSPEAAEMVAAGLVIEKVVKEYRAEHAEARHAQTVPF